MLCMSENLRPLIWIVFLLFLIIACENEETLEKTYEGQFSFGFEQSNFYPCGSNEVWWVIDGEEYSKLIEEVTALSIGDTSIGDSCQGAYVVLRGVKSEKGSYGHMGSFDREFRLTEVIDVRCGTLDDCE